MLRAMDSFFSHTSLAARASAFLLLSLGVSVMACEPPRMLVSDTGVSQPDAEPMDSGVVEDAGVDVDTGVRRDTGVAMDAADASDGSADCDFLTCDNNCVAMGATVGRCQMNRCNCIFPSGDAAVMSDANSSSDARADVVLESSIRGCMSNADCPPTMFCSASTCAGVGTCLVRQESDPNRCAPDPMPSCGCDGLLYPSACARTAVGVRQDPMRRCDGDAAVLPLSDASSGG